MIKLLYTSLFYLALETIAGSPCGSSGIFATNDLEAVSSTDIDALETAVVLPVEAKPLAAYARYYSAGKVGQISGLYILNGPDSPGRYLRPSPIIVADGGCSAIHVVFELVSRQIVSVTCNGRA